MSPAYLYLYVGIVCVHAGTHSRTLGGKKRLERGGELIIIIIIIPSHPHHPTPIQQCTGTLSSWFRRESEGWADRDMYAVRNRGEER